MAISELMVLWVDCMKLVGFSISSPSLQSCSRKSSVFSIHPSPVPVMMASGVVTPASFIAAVAVTIARFMILPIRRDSSGLSHSRKLGS